MIERPVRQAVSDACTKSVAILFKPFSWRKWTKLIFIGWLAGTLSGGLNFSGFDRPKESKESVKSSEQQPAQNAATSEGSPTLKPEQEERIKKQYENKYWYENSLFRSARNEEGNIPGWYMAFVVWPIIIVCVLLIIALLWFLIWLSARFQFAWYHAIEFDEVAIGASFRKYADQADSLMLFNIASSIILLGYFLAILLPSAYAVYQVSLISPVLISNIAFMLSHLWPAILLLIFSVLVLIVAYMIIGDFIVPIMATQRVYFMEAAKLWMPVYKANRARVWRYFLMKILCSIVGGALTMALTIPVLILALLVGAVVFVPLFLIFINLLKWNVVFWVLAVILGLPYLAALLLSMGACALPIGVFMRAYSLAFLNNIQFTGSSSPASTG